MKTTALLALSTLTAALPAQCLFTTVTTQSFGQGCNVGSTGFCKIVGLPTTLSASLDTVNCSLDLQVNLFEACGVTVPFRVLAFGFQPTFVQLPEFGPGCTLHVDPIGIMATTAGPFTLSLPPGVPALTFLAQGVALSLSPPGGQGADALTFTAGLQVNLQ